MEGEWKDIKEREEEREREEEKGKGEEKGEEGKLGMCAVLSQMHSSGESWLIPHSNVGCQFCSDLWGGKEQL